MDVQGDVLAELLRFAADTVDNAPSPESDNAIVIALIGGFVTVLVALIGLIGTRLVARSSKTPDSPPAPHDDVDHEAALERFVMRQGFDPNMIVTGDEWPNDVKFF